MTLKLIADLVGWMLFINIILLIIGFLKVTLFKKLVKNTMIFYLVTNQMIFMR